MWHTVPDSPLCGAAGHVTFMMQIRNAFAQFAVNIFDIPCSTDFNKTALAGIEAMEDYFRSIQMPTSLHELGLDLTEKEIHELAFKCSF